jgi:hypothetical protein
MSSASAHWSSSSAATAIARFGRVFDRRVRHERREASGLDRDDAAQAGDQRGLVRELALSRVV